MEKNTNEQKVKVEKKDRFPHLEIESKWKQKWEDAKLFHEVKQDPKKKKFVCMDMFPYPSGAGLHVGHMESYVAVDIYSRYMRMKGFNVMHPIGWDAFGLPAENFAIKVGESPEINTRKAIDNFRKADKNAGIAYNWDGEFASCDPEYYKWTQWLFLFMYKHGLAYKANSPVNWCSSCQTVLANEQVIDGKCERCDTEVVQRELDQWFFKITAYADQLSADIDKVDWLESTKTGQRNWIGRSKGATIKFGILTQESRIKNTESRNLKNRGKLPGEILFSTTNPSKVARLKKLLKTAGLKIKVRIPDELGIKGDSIVEDGCDLLANAKKKAYAYRGKVNMPILADDTGLYANGEDIDPVSVKRNALEGIDDSTLSQKAISQKIVAYYKKIAKRHGEGLPAEWHNVYFLLMPDGAERHAEAIRGIVLTDKVKGAVDISFPLRSMYWSKATGKFISEQTDDEELVELLPVTNALKDVFNVETVVRDIEVFTTRADTIFGATYLVLAPEHPLVNEITTTEQKEAVEAYRKQTEGKNELQRSSLEKEKTGVFTGTYAINPANGKEIPIWIADYVVMSYGTGAIMAVPAHDERDFEFARKFDLPVVEVIEPVTGTSQQDEEFRQSIVAIVEDPRSGKLLSINWGKELGGNLFVGGGIDEGESPEQTALREIKEETGYGNVKLVEKTGVIHHHYYAYSKKKNRYIQAIGLHFVLEGNKKNEQKLTEEEKDRFTVEWISKDDAKKRVEDSLHRLVFEKLIEGEVYTGAGKLVNSGEFDGLTSEIAAKKIVEKLGKDVARSEVKYKMRDWLISRQRYWGAPIPIIYCEKCGTVSVPEKDLPVLLPDDVKDFKPKGTSPLGTSKKFKENIKCPKCGGPARRELDTMDTFICSSWYFMRYADPHNSREFASAEALKYWMPVDLYIGGAEYVSSHLLFSRFFIKALFDKGIIPFDEPFLKLRHQGMILGEDHRKMSKRWGNVISPEDIVSEVGADSLRMNIMFMGPLQDQKSWNTKGLYGVRRFVDRLWKARKLISVGAEAGKDEQASKAELAAINRLIKRTGENIQELKFNVCVSDFMIFVNQMIEWGSVSKETWKKFICVLAPFAPFIAEELWFQLYENEKKEGKDDKHFSVHQQNWPKFDEKLVKEEEVTIAVQVNGKVRGEIIISPTADEKTAIASALLQENVKKYVKTEKSIKKTVYVKGRILNLIV